MAAIIPDTGREYISDRIEFYEFAIGTGTSQPTGSDTTLENEVYRADVEDTNCSITDTSTDGEVVAKLTISGGTEVPADTVVSEFALFCNDPDTTMVYREVRSGTNIESGARVTFEIELDVVTVS